MVWPLPTLKTFLKATIHHEILDLKIKIYLLSLLLTQIVMAVVPFSGVVPLLWNSLPQHIRDAGSLDVFKRRLKTFLFKRAYLNS